MEGGEQRGQMGRGRVDRGGNMDIGGGRGMRRERQGEGKGRGRGGEGGRSRLTAGENRVSKAESRFY